MTNTFNILCMAFGIVAVAAVVAVIPVAVVAISLLLFGVL